MEKHPTGKKEKLADQTTTIQDIIQDKGESVEKYHARLTQAFDDLAFSHYEKAHTCYQLLLFQGSERISEKV